jgi:VIT1/CCC1 family predicted Fe2+/Mn2+ transporter
MTADRLPARLARSFRRSAGDVVFGMEDGTVSIFGLVFGVAATTDQSSVVLIAGATGAAAAAVSMMAGTFLDVETTRDTTRARRATLEADLRTRPKAVAADVAARLQAGGVAPDATERLLGQVRADPAALAGLALALDGEGAAEPAPSPLGHALWMFAADLLAASIPILPFVFLPVADARWVSLGITAVLLVLLGIGRARIGARALLRTVGETVAIGAAAALAGLAIGTAIDRSFG